VVAADGIAGKYRPASVGHVVEDDVRVLPRVDLAQGDQTVEAVLEHTAAQVAMASSNASRYSSEMPGCAWTYTARSVWSHQHPDHND
jgi:hypothetical protein